MMVGFIILFLCFCVPLLSTLLAAPSSQANSPDEFLTPLSPIERLEKGHSKLDSQLNQLVAAEIRGKAASFAQQSAINLMNHKVRVIIEAAPGWGQVAARVVESLGVTVETGYADWLQVVVPISMLTALADDPNVRLVRLPRQFMPAVISEGVGLINVPEWHTAGFTGTGVKVGILDEGFSGYLGLLGTELPSTVNTYWAPSIGGPGT